MRIKPTSIFKGRVWWHILFWLAYWIYLAIPSAIYDDDLLQDFVRSGIQLPIRMIATYVLIYFLMPRYLYKNDLVSFFALLIPIGIILSIGQRIVTIYIIYPSFYPDKTFHGFPWGKVFYDFVSVYFIAAVAAIIKILKQWYSSQKDKEELEKDKLEAELKFLKAQIHPHFLFNTLNNLYALTLKQSPLASEVVLKLSDLLDYMLYECNAPTISLDKEIKLIENYISLEKIRYGDDLQIEFYIIGETAGLHISPMILLPLIENSFKHGVSGEIFNKWIKISLTVNEGILVFSIENSKDEKNKDLKRSYTEGIGLNNITRRLELSYKERSKFTVTDKNNKFIAELRINLN